MRSRTDRLNFDFEGAPIFIEFAPALRVARGKLVRNGSGIAVHAAGYLRERRVVLDSELLANRRELDRIVAHEIFHFVWWKLGNTMRVQYEDLLQNERWARARGETGWSAEWRKQALKLFDVTERTTRWREYCCESFCDTGAFTACGTHGEVTLASRYLKRRAHWFGEHIAGKTLRI